MSLLKLYNVYIDTKRTSIRLEPLFWKCLNDMAKDGGITVSAICTRVLKEKQVGTLTSNLRACILAYALSRNINDAMQIVSAPLITKKEGRQKSHTLKV